MNILITKCVNISFGKKFKYYNIISRLQFVYGQIIDNGSGQLENNCT